MSRLLIAAMLRTARADRLQACRFVGPARGAAYPRGIHLPGSRSFGRLPLRKRRLLLPDFRCHGAGAAARQGIVRGRPAIAAARRRPGCTAPNGRGRNQEGDQARRRSAPGGPRQGRQPSILRAIPDGHPASWGFSRSQPLEAEPPPVARWSDSKPALERPPKGVGAPEARRLGDALDCPDVR